MKNILIAIATSFVLLVSSCSKSGTDNTAAWVGVYAAQPGSAFDRIIISKADDNTLKVELKTTQNSYSYTYAILQKVTLQNPTQAAVNENTYITEYIGQYSFKGSITVKNGTVLILNGSATGTANETDVKSLYFVGDRVQ